MQGALCTLAACDSSFAGFLQPPTKRKAGMLLTAARAFDSLPGVKKGFSIMQQVCWHTPCKAQTNPQTSECWIYNSACFTHAILSQSGVQLFYAMPLKAQESCVPPYNGPVGGPASGSEPQQADKCSSA